MTMLSCMAYRHRVAAHRPGRAHLHRILSRRSPSSATMMVGQQMALKFRLVLRLKQHLDRAGRQLGERLAGRRENRERAGAFQGLHEIGCGERLRERLERPGGDCRVDDVPGLSVDNRRSATAPVVTTAAIVSNSKILCMCPPSVCVLRGYRAGSDAVVLSALEASEEERLVRPGEPDQPAHTALIGENSPNCMPKSAATDRPGRGRSIPSSAPRRRRECPRRRRPVSCLPAPWFPTGQFWFVCIRSSCKLK